MKKIEVSKNGLLNLYILCIVLSFLGANNLAFIYRAKYFSKINKIGKVFETVVAEVFVAKKNQEKSNCFLTAENKKNKEQNLLKIPDEYIAKLSGTFMVNDKTIYFNRNSLDEYDIIKHAPEVRFHPDEYYFPMSPLEFIRISRFRHYKGRMKRDEGYSKLQKNFVKGNSKNSEYYNVPVVKINSYGIKNGKNRRPRDSNKGMTLNVFIQPDENPTGSSAPTSKIAVYYDVTEQGYGWAISYWFFFGYNNGPLIQNHQGDWEKIVVLLDENRQITGVEMSAHGSHYFYPNGQFNLSGTHPIIYSANGSHANYPKPGIFPTKICIFKDKTANGGKIWKTWKLCADLKLQPWKDFAGAWGEVGATSYTTGPLGPWHKRRPNKN